MDIRVDGSVFATILADKPRPDLKAAGLGDGSSGFDFAMPAASSLRATQRVEVVIAGTEIQLHNSPLSLAPKASFFGHLDGVDGLLVSGWIIDLNKPDESVAVEAICDGKVVGAVVAAGKRPDVAAAGMPSERCGFRIALKASIRDLVNRDVHLRVVGSDYEPPGSPCRIAPMHAVLRFLDRCSLVRPETAPRLARSLSRRTRDARLSIVMPVLNTTIEWLMEAIESVRRQWNPRWELICVDDGSTVATVAETLRHFAREDGRIKLVFMGENRGIAAAVNAGLGVATGEYVTFLDHDDFLEPDAVHRLVFAAINTGADLVYSDEVLTTEDIDCFIEQRCRPAFSHDYYLSHPYFVHMICVPLALARAIGGWDETMPISADVDFVLRVVERARMVAHVPAVLYRWRTHGASAGHEKEAEVGAATRLAIGRHLDRLGLQATVEEGLGFNQFRVEWPDDRGEVLIVIPTKNRVDLLRACIQSIERTSPGENFRIVVIDHDSDDPETRAYLDEIAAVHSVMPYHGPFNYAAMNNLAVRAHGGSARYLLLLNNDIEAVEPGWIARMRSLAARPDVGAVGPLLLYGDRLVQHAGVLVGFNGAADHAMRFADAFSGGGRSNGYNCILTCLREYSAVTAACMMTRLEVFNEVNGFDEKFVVGFNDTDLCLRIGETGRKVLYDGFTWLYHHEHATRRADSSIDHPSDTGLLHRRWPCFFGDGDPFYNKGLAREGRDHTPRLDRNCAANGSVRLVELSPHGRAISFRPDASIFPRDRLFPPERVSSKPPRRVETPSGSLLHSFQTIGSTPPVPDIRNGDLMTPVVRAIARDHWGVPLPDREFGIYQLRDVYVVDEGLIFDGALNLIDSSVFQASEASILAAQRVLVEARTNRTIPTVAGVTLLCGKTGLNNYGHWMMEIAPRVHIASSWILKSGWNVLVPRVYTHMAAVVDETLRRLDVPAARVIKGVGDPIHVDELVFMPDFSAHGRFYPPEAISCMDTLARDIESGPHRKVWISRVGDARTLAGEADLCDTLARRGWRIVEPGKLTLPEQIAIAKGARHMAGVIGAGLTNLGFMGSGGLVTGFMPANMPDVFFYHLASMRGLRYREVRASLDAQDQAPAQWNGVLQLTEREVLAHLECDDD